MGEAIRRQSKALHTLYTARHSPAHSEGRWGATQSGLHVGKIL